MRATCFHHVFVKLTLYRHVFWYIFFIFVTMRIVEAMNLVAFIPYEGTALKFVFKIEEKIFMQNFLFSENDLTVSSLVSSKYHLHIRTVHLLWKEEVEYLDPPKFVLFHWSLDAKREGLTIFISNNKHSTPFHSKWLVP